MAGQLWVIMGGGTIKNLKPYTNVFADKIGEIFNANEIEMDPVKKQLKYLLSNSRRTFTEFVLEIFIAVLSLIYGDTVPEITIELWNILEELCIQNIKDKQTKTKTNPKETRKTKTKTKRKRKTNKNNKRKKGKNTGNENENENENDLESKKESLKNDQIMKKLENIYERIFKQEVLMYWFNKRFCERLGQFFPFTDQNKFYKLHLLFLGKSKFLLSCMLLTKELMNRKQIFEKYFLLITEPFDGDPLNLFFHKRAGKLKIIKALINESGLNNGEYWKIISKDFIQRIAYDPEGSVDYFPFKNILNNPKLLNLMHGKVRVTKPKTRIKASSLKEQQNLIKADWLFKRKIN